MNHECGVSHHQGEQREVCKMHCIQAKQRPNLSVRRECLCALEHIVVPRTTARGGPWIREVR